MSGIRALALALLVTVAAHSAPKRKLDGLYTATAYTVEGQTDSGLQAQKGVVAADTDLLPIGTRIRITGAGQYSGEYVVADSGRKIQGRQVDIYIRDNREAKNFGKKRVQVKVLQLGAGK